MLFHTWTFAAFFLIVYPIHLFVKNTRFAKYWLLVASCVFYGWWRPQGRPWTPAYLYLMLYCTIVDYVAGRLMAATTRRKMFLAIAVVNHLLVLGYCKYAIFFTRNANVLLGRLGAPALPIPDIILPIGVSFYTFQAMSYVIDLYRGDVEVERHPVRFAAFVTLFPQLVAGPIERGAALLPQLRRKVRVHLQNVTDGLSLFLVGFFKKRAIADFLAIYVESVYGSDKVAPTLGTCGSPQVILATFAFAWQIYFDFSGYTDMARGLAKMMGYNLMVNFNKPYLSADLGEFWKRWHISLSSWFRDYVYIPLGGNRRGRARTWVNMFITMVVSGFWHGAAWTFVIWGFLHALGLAVTKLLQPTKGYRRVPKPVKQTLVFCFVCFAWIFFRARSLGDALLAVRTAVTGPWLAPTFPVAALILCLAVWLHQAGSESRLHNLLHWAPVRLALATGMLVYLVFASSSGVQQFIYFQF